MSESTTSESVTVSLLALPFYRLSVITLAWRLGVLVSPLMLISCVPYESPRTELIDLPIPPVQTIRIPQDSQAKNSWFAKLVLNLPKGTKFGSLQVGAFCITKDDLRWEGGPQVLTEEDIRTAFNEVLQKSNYPVVGKVDALFEDLSGAELIVAGLVKGLEAKICNAVTIGLLGPTKFETRADLSMKVNWQVFSRVEGKVVYETATQGRYEGNGNLRAAIIGAFANATERLLAERSFYDLVVQPKKGKV